ncbi:hypothetical protein FIA58_006270 [Flavobacterium jejuense]|uniref:Uncharacterized protein n=1 Tax=Flavobacterium jejuense TaxID=1544455 RepID=A0ABX0IR72_9FLAO|nr:hypothetical protein [Flavobacterium jejuense]NHN25279.1 hypothetical protein [Flavobacterium jejuense]
MNNKKRYNNKKKSILKIGCFLGVINIIISIIDIITNIENIDFLIANNLIAFICILGICRMKIWAIFTYIAVFVVNQVILVLCNQWVFFQTLLPLIVISIALKKIDEMGL